MAVILDDDERLSLWHDDLDDVWLCLRKLRGKLGLAPIAASELFADTAGVSGRFPVGSHVLALSDLGCLERSGDRIEQWAGLGRALRQRGIEPWALTPLPAECLHGELTRLWHIVVWDGRRPRALAAPGAEPNARLKAITDGETAATELLRLLSVSVRVERGLLRAVRRALPGGRFNAGHEYWAWNHAAVAGRMRRVRTLGVKAATRWLDTLGEADLDDLAHVCREMRPFRGYCSPAIAPLEMQLLRKVLHRAGCDHANVRQRFAPDEAWRRSAEFQRKLVLGMWEGDSRHAQDLAIWSDTQCQWLKDWLPTPEWQAMWALKDRTLGGGLANVPAQVDWENIAWTIPRETTEQQYEVGTDTSTRGLVAIRWVAPESANRRGFVPICLFRTRNKEIGLEARKLGRSTDKLRVTLPAGAPSEVVGFDESVERAELETIRERYGFVRETRPSWASRMGCDCFGLYADLELAERVTLRLRWIPPGTFLMGSPADEAGRLDIEGPRHEVTISSGYWLAATPVTQAQWRAVMGDDHSHHSAPDSAELPIENISWHEARNFGVELAERFPELVIELPTEAEWEYACRAGTESAFNDGSDCTVPEGDDLALNRLGWYGANSDSKTHPVEKRAPNTWGLYDMHGNVWEWCLDGLREYREGAERDPTGPLDGGDRVVRGGSCSSRARSCRSAFRKGGKPGDFGGLLGFRLAAGQETGHSARGLAEKAARDATPGGQAVRGVRRARPWAQRFARDTVGVRLEFELEGAHFLWRWIPRGRFVMGSPEDETGRFNDESPQHDVTLSKGFWLAATPCTQAQWEAVTGKNPSHFRGKDRPVEGVSWEECSEYCAALNELLPTLEARLPIEAEWEYACRAGTASAFNDDSDCTAPEGKDPVLERLGWYDKNSGGETHPVAQKDANAWGLYDMHGNVWEWCQDWHGKYEPGAQTDPRGPNTGDYRVLRGGSWRNHAGRCRSAYRRRYPPGIRFDSLGFRLAAGQPPEAVERSERREAEGADAPGPRDEASATRPGRALTIHLVDKIGLE